MIMGAIIKTTSHCSHWNQGLERNLLRRRLVSNRNGFYGWVVFHMVITTSLIMHTIIIHLVTMWNPTKVSLNYHKEMINRYNQNPSENIITGNRENDKDIIFLIWVYKGQRVEETGEKKSWRFLLENTVL